MFVRFPGADDVQVAAIRDCPASDILIAEADVTELDELVRWVVANIGPGVDLADHDLRGGEAGKANEREAKCAE